MRIGFLLQSYSMLQYCPQHCVAMVHLLPSTAQIVPILLLPVEHFWSLHASAGPLHAVPKAWRIWQTPFCLQQLTPALVPQQSPSLPGVHGTEDPSGAQHRPDLLLHCNPAPHVPQPVQQLSPKPNVLSFGVQVPLKQSSHFLHLFPHQPQLLVSVPSTNVSQPSMFPHG